jgi:hypothetical protein
MVQQDLFGSPSAEKSINAEMEKAVVSMPVHVLEMQ